jgi:hypothetical protein
VVVVVVDVVVVDVVVLVVLLVVVVVVGDAVVVVVVVLLVVELVVVVVGNAGLHSGLVRHDPGKTFTVISAGIPPVRDAQTYTVLLGGTINSG